MRKKGLLKKLMSGILVSAMALSTVSAGMISQGMKASAEDATTAANTEIVYHAALGIQTAGGNKKQSKALWMNRFGYFGKLAASGSKNLSKYGTEYYNKLSDDSLKGPTKSWDGTFTDVEIKDNGEYTVSLDGADFAGETVCSQLHVATDIPLSSKIQVSNLRVSVDDKQILKIDDGILDDDTTYLEFGKVFLAINHWRDAVEELGTKAGLKTADNGFKIFTGEKGEKVAITFMVSGFNKAQEQKVQKQEQQKKELEKLVGKTKTIAGLRYKITKATKNGGTVTLTKDTQSKKVRKVPATVKIDGKTYTVSAIGKAAFSKNKKLQKVVIGKNVKTISSKAFYGCKKLKTIDVKKNMTLKKVGKNIVKNKKCKVLVSKKKKKAYTKLFKGLVIK